MESTLRRTWAEINLDALTYNYQQIKAHIGQDVKFIGVVKADAYGHGSVTVAKHLQDLGVEYLAVSSIDEAIELRVNSITMPILILGHTPKEQVDRLICFNITQAVTCEAKALEYSEEAVKYGGRLKIHLKVDTGMSRLGYLCDGDHFKTGVEGIVNAAQLPGLEAEGIFTHFSMADEEDERAHDYTLEQFNLFMNLVTTVEDAWDGSFPLSIVPIPGPLSLILRPTWIWCDLVYSYMAMDRMLRLGVSNLSWRLRPRSAPSRLIRLGP